VRRTGRGRLARAIGGGRVWRDGQGVTGPSALEFLARDKEEFAAAMERVPDGDLLGVVAPAPRQNDDIRILEDNKDRVGESDSLQPRPIEPGMPRLEPAVASKLD
jgi:hypothetical protein